MKKQVTPEQRIAELEKDRDSLFAALKQADEALQNLIENDRRLAGAILELQHVIASTGLAKLPQPPEVGPVN